MLRLEVAGYFVLVFLAGIGAGYLGANHRWGQLAATIAVFAIVFGGIAWQSRRRYRV